MIFVRRTSMPHRFLSRRIAPFALLLLVFLLPGCSSTSQKDNNILATVGHGSITRSQFTQRLTKLLREQGIPDNAQVRRQLMQTMINEELLLQEARNRGMDKDALAHEQFGLLHEKALLNAYSRKHIIPNIVVTDHELEELYIRFNTTITARHLFAQTFAQAQQLRNRLQQGESFELLAREVFEDPTLRNNGGLLPPFSADDTELAFENAAYSLSVGEVSQPVKLKNGFSIIKVESRITKPILTHQEFVRKRDQMVAFLRQRKLKQAAKEYTEQIRDLELQLSFNDEAMSEFWQMLQQSNKDDIHFAELKKSPIRPEQDLFTASGHSFSADDCLELMEKSTETETGWTHSPQQLEELISGLLVRKTLLDRARSEGLDQGERYKAEVKDGSERFLLKRIQESIQANQPIPEDSLQSFYSTHKKQFNQPESILLRGIRVTTREQSYKVENMLQGGESFEIVSRLLSNDRESAERGGLLGVFTQKDLGPDVSAVWELNEGEWLGPVELPGGQFSYFQVAERHPASTLDYTEILPAIRTQYRKEMGQQLVQSFCDGRRREVSIDVDEDRLLQGGLRVEGQP